MKYPVLIAFLIVFSAVTSSFAQKLNAGQVVANHLDSIGSAAKRAEVRNWVTAANVVFKAKGTPNRIEGKAVLVSAGQKNLWGMVLSSNEYPKDTFGFDGENVRAGFIRPATYSTIGGFIRSYREVLREGLLGGSLFSSWALMHADVKKPKLSYEGTKKIDGIETHVLDYGVKGGSDLAIKMYFDAKTFRHVRTEYTHLIAARQGANVDASAGQTPDRYKVTEDFSEFQNVGGFTLPRKYILSYSFSGASPVRLVQANYKEVEWNFDVTNFVINQDIDPASFEIGAN